MISDLTRAGEERPRPNLFIVGAARSGTTSLANYLGQHPAIYMSPVKEPSFFIPGYSIEKFEEYLLLFKDAGKARIIGEASTGYLFAEGAAQAIRERFRDAKIIIILRNPVNMVFSLWQFMRINGSESKTFVEAIREDERAFRKSDSFKKSCAGWWGFFLYLERGLYFGQVKKYLDLFGEDRVSVNIYERFFGHPEKSCQRLFEFLGVDRTFVPECKVYNEGGMDRFPAVTRVKGTLYPFSQRFLPIKVRDRIGKWIRRVNVERGRKMELDKETRDFLVRFFREDVTNLEKLLGYAIPEWREE
jgi:hypothetical protein